MSDIHITREHNFDMDTARSKIDGLKDRLVNTLGFNTEWQGNDLTFSGKGSSGAIKLQENSVEVTMKLGMFLKPMKGRIEEGIQQGIDEALA